MVPERPALERRVLAALDGSSGSGPRIPVLLGGCGSGRTSLLLRLRDLIGRGQSQYVDVERVATTPERFLQAIRDSSPFPALAYGSGTNGDGGARDAFDATLAFLDTARAPGTMPATFLLDEFLELRTFESFPGLRTVLRDLTSALSSSGNRFVLTTRYAARAHRLLRDAPAQFEIIHVTPLSAAEIRATLPASNAADRVPGLRAEEPGTEEEQDRRRDEIARLVQALSGGRPSYARAIAETTAAMAQRGTADPVSALAALLTPGGALTNACRFCYELRLHRARGYGALKAILEVLAEEEPLTLTEIAHRLRRTPGSTKDYLSWLEDVDLVVSQQKRYSFADPMLRLWVRLHCRPVPPGDDDVARELHGYVMSRMPHAEPTLALAGPPVEREKYSGIIEID
jgi:alkylhydroperoxidase family enzyme